MNEAHVEPALVVASRGEDSVEVVASTRAHLHEVAGHVLGGRPVRHHHVVVRRWTAATPAWTGTMGFLPGLRGLSITIDEPADGGRDVHVDVTVGPGLPPAQVAQALLRFLYPTPRNERWVAPAVSAVGPAVATVAGLTGAALMSVPAVEADDSTLVANDVVLGAELSDDLTGTAQHRLSITELTRPHQGPHVDLGIHHPQGRLSPLVHGTRARVDVEPDGVWLHVPHQRAIALSRDRALDEHDLAALHQVESVDLSGLTGHWQTPNLGDRLAELTCSGVVMHDGTGAEVLTHWPSGLTELLARPYESVTGLRRELRSLEQRRTAMETFGRPMDGGNRLLAAHLAPPHVSVLLVSRRPALAAQMVEMLTAQVYPDLDVVVALHGVPALDLGHLSDAARALVSTSFAVPSTTSFGEVLGLATARAQGELVTKVDDDDHYGPHHVSDLVLTRRHSGAELVGRRSEFAYLENIDTTVARTSPTEVYSSPVAGGTMLISRADLLEVGGWRPVSAAVDRGLLVRVRDAGGLVYAATGVGYVYVRHGRGHTWVQPTTRFLVNTHEQWPGLHRPALGAGRRHDHLEVSGTATP